MQLFVAGIVPGLLTGFGFMALCYWYALRYNWPVEQIFEWGKLWSAFKHAFWALTLPIIILGGIFGGIVTALIPLYAIGVFLSFTLSQAGMTRRW